MLRLKKLFFREELQKLFLSCDHQFFKITILKLISRKVFELETPHESFTKSAFGYVACKNTKMNRIIQNITFSHFLSLA